MNKYSIVGYVFSSFELFVLSKVSATSSVGILVVYNYSSYFNTLT